MPADEIMLSRFYCQVEIIGKGRKQHIIIAANSCHAFEKLFEQYAEYQRQIVSVEIKLIELGAYHLKITNRNYDDSSNE